MAAAPARAPVLEAPAFEEAPTRRRSPLMLIAAGVVVVAAVGAGAMMMMRGRGGQETPPPAAPPPTRVAAPTPAPPPVDSAALRAADSARAAEAAAAAMGVVRILGDLPEDAEISLDTIIVRGTTAHVAPGSYTLSVETAEFKPWERRVTVRAGDTLRVRVELELLDQDTTQ